jgi:hypothetical protein
VFFPSGQHYHDMVPLLQQQQAMEHHLLSLFIVGRWDGTACLSLEALALPVRRHRTLQADQASVARTEPSVSSLGAAAYCQVPETMWPHCSTNNGQQGELGQIALPLQGRTHASGICFPGSRIIKQT